MTTETLSSKITGHDYLSAHFSRMTVNNNYFLEVAKELTEAGYKVYIPKDGLINFMHIESEDKQITFGYTDVPSTWYLSCDINYKLGHGSSRTIEQCFDYNSPFTASQIISKMQPKQPTITKAETYLKLFTL